MKNINCKGKLIDLTQARVMGILNLTPDSFYDGGQFSTQSQILEHTKKMLLEGATFIDVGGASSRPGASIISENEELKRVIPAIKALQKEFPDILISIDSFRSKVVKEAIKSGACMINDISAGELDTNMFKTAVDLQVPYILMHMQGTPQNMQNKPVYDDLVTDLFYYFSKKLRLLREMGLNDPIVDLGFGFGKTRSQNYELLKNMAYFKNLDIPMLTGLSRKSMLYSLFNGNSKTALNATTAANTIALINGTNILRVHDVAEAMEAIKIVEALNGSSQD